MMAVRTSQRHGHDTILAGSLDTVIVADVRLRSRQASADASSATLKCGIKLPVIAVRGNLTDRSTIQQIEQAIRQLSTEERAAFRA